MKFALAAAAASALLGQVMADVDPIIIKVPSFIGTNG